MSAYHQTLVLVLLEEEVTKLRILFFKKTLLKKSYALSRINIYSLTRTLLLLLVMQYTYMYKNIFLNCPSIKTIFKSS